MTWLIALLVVVGLFAVYMRWVRPYLKSLPQFADIYMSEANAWQAIKVWVVGRKTILAGIWGELLIWLPDILQGLNIADFATALHWDDGKKAIANIVLTILMIIFRAKAATP